jgi:hypothetical protein
VRADHIEWVRQRLTDRDRAIVKTLGLLRLATGSQLERLHFADLNPESGPVVRRRVLGRLSRWGVLVTGERRIGGIRAGSTGLIYALDTVGQHLLVTSDVTPRRPGLPGERFLAHVLAVAELYVALVERQRLGQLGLSRFFAEPASWWPNQFGGWLKPDAYALLSTATHDDAWWIEVDRATESLPTLQAKLTTYLDFARSGQAGPVGLVPRVLVTVPDEARLQTVTRLIHRLPAPADTLFVVERFDKATAFLEAALHR